MSSKRTLYGTVSRLLGRGAPSQSTIPPRNQLNTGKKDESTNVISSNTSTQSCRELKDIPGPWPSLPFIGTGWQYFPGSRYCFTNLFEAAQDKYRRYGPIVKEEFQWRKPSIQLYNPDDFETVFRYQGRHPFRPISDFLVHYRQKYPEKYDNAGLANIRGEEWERLRRIIGPILLRPKSLHFLMGSMNEVAEDFVKLLRSTRNPTSFLLENTQDMAYRLALEGVYLMSLDTRLGCLDVDLQKDSPASDMILSVKLLFESFQELFFAPPLWKFFETASYKKLHKAESLMYNATSKRIQEALEKLRNSTTDPKEEGVLHTLLQKKKLNDKELIVTVIDLISGGIFTVANSFSFLIYHISRNPEAQEKLYQELKEKMPDSEITNERLAKIDYLNACVKESFRLTPTIPCINRILPEDVVLSGYQVPAGTSIFCNFPIPCKQADKFPEPERFIPDRWLDRSTQTHNPFTLVPFGFGQRMCIGRRFAEMEMYSALAKLVYNFKLEPAGPEVKTKSAFILVPSDPVSVILKDR